MKRKKYSAMKKLVALVMTLAVSMIAVQGIAFAKDDINILVLGDSISSGFGLETPSEDSFASLLDAESEYSVVNRAVTGNKAADVLGEINDGTISEKDILSADIVTITVGGNDLMAVLYAAIAEKFNESSDTEISPEEAVNMLGQVNRSNFLSNLSLLQSARELLTKTADDTENTEYVMESQAFLQQLESYLRILTEITAVIKETNPDVRIFVATQYNPYEEFKGAALLNGMVSLNSVYDGVEDGVTKLNNVIVNNADDCGYTVVDVKSAFDAKEEDLYNASPDVNAISFDFHPNAEGHAVLAEIFGKAFKGEEYKENIVEHWAKKDVDYVLEKGLMNGISKEEFGYDEMVTRAMLVTILYRAEGEPVVNRSIPFSDVDMGAYYANSVSWMKQTGIVNGVTENEFAPDENITREQIAAVMFRYATYKGRNTVVTEENLLFDDRADVSEYAISAMNWAVGAGLINGKTENTLNPRDNASRAEIAAIIHRFIESDK